MCAAWWLEKQKLRNVQRGLAVSCKDKQQGQTDNTDSTDSAMMMLQLALMTKECTSIRQPSDLQMQQGVLHGCRLAPHSMGNVMWQG